ncbi:ATP-binding response regulator [Azotobacter chroococcum]|uniref:ATP-binding response regulator n=1 Tax=Azotobacter chroococcum TaxID=353 RepID=UPI0010ADADD2|nr:hybrid sensor histidine kinase/response regulator [Azotobacter chroococcum]TKD44882.1 response regulator [Azotobacter chroococcum]
MPISSKVGHDTERSQAIIRLVIPSLVILYIAILYFTSPTAAEWIVPVLSYIMAFLVVSLVLFIAIVRQPGVYPLRRLFGMLHDYSGITFTLIIGGKVLLPVYAILLWVTVGNGLRFGSRYLAVATGLALLTLGIVTGLTPYWREQPYVVITLVITTIIVPAYVHVLLKQTRRASEAAIAANLAKSRFLAQASHDLRQPIHSISLFTACLRDADLGAKERQMVDNIDKSLHSVSQLFRSILDIYTLDSGKVVPRLEVTPVRELLASLVQQNAEAARWAGVEVRVRPTRCCVRCDPVLLTTMLQNILSNTFKYAPGKPVLIGCRSRDGALAIEIYDQGKGIAPEHLTKVFDEFYRGQQVRDKDIEGVGLGLSIVKRLGELMSLDVRIGSRPGRGTVAIIQGLELASAQEVRPSTGHSMPVHLLRGLHVTLIEDDRNVLVATASLLEKWGCIVQTETSMPMRKVDCDLIVTDFDLNTEVSGADCIEHLRRLHGRKIPAVVITGHDVKHVQELLGNKEIPVLSKPIRPSELRSVLTALRLDMAPQASA